MLAVGASRDDRQDGYGYCDQCGDRPDSGDHARCARRRELEPPRYCPACARRMVVQVTPTGWTARCSRHGMHSSGDR